MSSRAAVNTTRSGSCPPTLSSTLHISEVTQADDGEYICVAVHLVVSESIQIPISIPGKSACSMRRCFPNMLSILKCYCKNGSWPVQNDKYIYWICHSSWQWWMTAWVHHARTMGCAMIVLLDMSVSVVRVLLEYTAVIQVIIYVVMPSKNVIMGVEHWFLYRINKTDFLRCLHTIFITSRSRRSGVSQHHSTSSEPKPFPGPACQPDLWGWRKSSSPVPVVQRWNRDSGSFSPLSLH